MKDRDIHKLFAESGNRCNFPDCNQLLFPKNEDGTYTKLAELCHIIASSPDGPRGNLTLSRLKREDLENIILLCRNCHKKIDDNPSAFTVERLKDMKENHIKWVNERLAFHNELNWTLLIHAGNINGKGLVKIDEDIIFKEFLGFYTLSNVEKLLVDEYLTKTGNWAQYITKQEEWWKKYQESKTKPQKLVICSINFISLVIHLGFLIHDTFISEIFQFDRFRESWKWQELNDKVNSKNTLNINNPIEESSNISEIALSISISGLIKDKDIFKTLGEIPIIKITVAKPNRSWLEYKEQLIQFHKVFLKLLDKITNNFSNIKKIHLFFTGPTPMAFKIGASINPNIHPQFVLYNYHRKHKPRYSKVVALN